MGAAEDTLRQFPASKRFKDGDDDGTVRELDNVIIIPSANNGYIIKINYIGEANSVDLIATTFTQMVELLRDYRV